MEKLLPYNLDAEVAILAAVLDSKSTFVNDIFSKVVREDFYYEHHRKIFDTLRSLYEQGAVINRIILLHELGDQSEQIGGRAQIENIAEMAHHDNKDLLSYIKIVRDLATVRRLTQALENSLEACHSSMPVKKLFPYVLNKVWQSGLGSDLLKEPVALKDYLPPVKSFLEMAYATKGKTVIGGIATKFLDLDRLTGGLHKKDFIVVGGRPNMGKTSLATQLALETAKAGGKVHFFSFELSGHALLLRMLCSEARVDCHKIRTGYLAKDDFQKLTETANRINDLPIWIEDAPRLGLHEIWTQAQASQNIHDGLDLVIIDTVQLINVPEEDKSKEQTRAEQTGATARGLKYMAQDLDVALLATSQVSRDLEKRKHKRPRLSDLRESGALEEHADLVMFLHRQEIFEPTEENAGLAELIIAKQRNGPPGIVKLAFLKEYIRFENLLTM